MFSVVLERQGRGNRILPSLLALHRQLMITSDSPRWKSSDRKHRVLTIYSSPVSTFQPVSLHQNLDLALCQRMGVRAGEQREYIMYTIE